MVTEAESVGRSLVDAGLIDEKQLAAALAQSAAKGGSLGFHLAQHGAIAEEDVARIIAVRHGIEYVDLRNTVSDVEALKLVSKATALKFGLLPLVRKRKALVCAVTEPGAARLNQLSKDLKSSTGLDLECVIATESFISMLIEHYYGQLEDLKIVAADGGQTAPLPPYAAKTPAPMDQAELSAIMVRANEEAELVMLGEDKNNDDELTSEGSLEDSLVTKLCNSIIAEAVRLRASDIHIEPFEKNLLVRFRINGMLRLQQSPPSTYKRALCARFKIMARLDIMERRRPQDGRIKIMVGGRKVDLRVATCPVLWGEKVVMRVLDQENLQTDLGKLGFEDEDLARFKEAIFSPYGLVIVTGPTGSGKTVTLYSALSTVSDPKLNIMTAEDPVEYNLPMINQVPVNPEVGMGFAAALRSFLRCDPDIILVGEIRDLETGQIAVRAAMTGHLVMTTLHTNDAPSAVNRLEDMGIESFYIGTTVKAIVAQRLLPTLCPECKEPFSINAAELAALRVPAGFFDRCSLFRRRKSGCRACGGTGNQGRTAIYEVMVFSESIVKLVFAKAPVYQLREAALQEGMNSLRVSALKKVRQGTCCLADVVEMFVAD